jgi:hypothetical protein
MILLPTTRVRKSYYLFSGHLFYIMGGFRCWRHEDRHFIETKPWIGILQMPTLDIFYLMLQTKPNNVRDGENIRLHPLTANGEMGPGLDSPVAGMPGMRFCWFCTLWAMTLFGDSPKYLKVAWILILFVLQNYKEVNDYRHVISKISGQYE